MKYFEAVSRGLVMPQAGFPVLDARFTPPRLDFSRLIPVPEVSQFVPEVAFGTDNPCGVRFHCWPEFKDCFFGTSFEAVPARMLFFSDADTRPADVVARMSKEGLVEIGHFHWLLLKQAGGQFGSLLTDGRANIALVSAKNEPRLAFAHFLNPDRGWDIYTYPVSSPDAIAFGDRVIYQV